MGVENPDMKRELVDLQRKFLAYLHWRSKQPMTPKDILEIPGDGVKSSSLAQLNSDKLIRLTE
jgi:hypothetical protein